MPVLIAHVPRVLRLAAPGILPLLVPFVLAAGPALANHGACFGYPATIEGTSADDTITGTHGRDVLHDGGGSDFLDGGPGADVAVLCPDGKPDRVWNVERIVRSSRARV